MWCSHLPVVQPDVNTNTASRYTHSPPRVVQLEGSPMDFLHLLMHGDEVHSLFVHE